MRVCELVGYGYMRQRKDGILEYTVGKISNIRKLMKAVKPFIKMKKKQVSLMLEILDLKESMKTKQDFIELADKINIFQTLNHSKTRKTYTLTP